MLVVHGAGRFKKILQDIYLAKFMVLRRASCAILTSPSGQGSDSSSKGRVALIYLHLQVSRTGFGGNSCCCWIGSLLWKKTHLLQALYNKFWLLLEVGGSQKYKAQEIKRGSAPVISVIRLSSLCQRLTSTRFGNPYTMCLTTRVLARYLRPAIASTDTRRLCMASLTAGRMLATSSCGARTIIVMIIPNRNVTREEERMR